VKLIPNESGIEGFISAGLGKHIGAAVPLLFLGTVSLGMPSSALIVGEYVKNFTGGGVAAQLITAFLIVFSGVFTNLTGIRTGATIQLAITLFIAIIGVSLLLLARPTAFGQGSLIISSSMIASLFPGIVVSFWAFAGFENLTFIAGEFKNPSRDIKLSMFIALLLSGLLYLLLSESCASHIAQENINPIAGLYQLAETVPSKHITTFVITIFAFLAVQINFNSWIWGISRLIYSSAQSNKFPSYFSTLNNKHIPARAIYLLAIIFSSVLLFSVFFLGLLKSVLVVVSTNFVFIYFLCMISYIFLKKWNFLKFVAVGLFFIFLMLLLSSKWLVLYPLVLLIAGILYNLNNHTLASR
jgi:amino acid efflux transporter